MIESETVIIILGSMYQQFTSLGTQTTVMTSWAGASCKCIWILRSCNLKTLYLDTYISLYNEMNLCSIPICSSW